MSDRATLLDEVSVTEARQMRQHYDNVAHGKRPFLITRYHDPGAVVMPREDLARTLQRYRFTLAVCRRERSNGVRDRGPAGGVGCPAGDRV